MCARDLCMHAQYLQFELVMRDVIDTLSAGTGFKFEYQISAGTLISADTIIDKMTGCCFLD